MVEKPTDCLSFFDSLDLSDMRERRLGVYALEDYYGTILAHFGEDHFQFTSKELEQGIGTQWNKVKSRLESIDLTDTPDKYNEAIHHLSSVRNSVAHDYRHNPRVDYLKEAREMADEWTDWLDQKAKEYTDIEDSFTVREHLVKMKLEALRRALTNPKVLDYDDLKEEQKKINSSAVGEILYTPNDPFEIEWNGDFEFTMTYSPDSGQFLSELDSDPSHHDLQQLATAIQLENKADNVISINSARRSNELSYQEEIARDNIKEPIRCVLVDEYEEDSQEVQIAIDHPTMVEEHFWQSLPNLDESVRKKLKELDEGDSFWGWLERTRDPEQYHLKRIDQ